MMGFGFGFGMIFMIFFWVAVVALFVWSLSAAIKGGSRTPDSEDPSEIASERYARGEISRQEFEQLKKDLES